MRGIRTEMLNTCKRCELGQTCAKNVKITRETNDITSNKYERNKSKRKSLKREIIRKRYSESLMNPIGKYSNFGTCRLRRVFICIPLQSLFESTTPP